MGARLISAAQRVHTGAALPEVLARLAQRERLPQPGLDLVFYNVILKCYLLIDLKLGKLTHQDVGQMDSCVRLFDAEGRSEGDAPVIGLILCAEKNEAIARYSVLHEHEQLFAAKYVTYLPTVEELERELIRDKRLLEAHGATGLASKKGQTQTTRATRQRAAEMRGKSAPARKRSRP
jgi:hypothetical protein